MPEAAISEYFYGDEAEQFMAIPHRKVGAILPEEI